MAINQLLQPIVGDYSPFKNKNQQLRVALVRKHLGLHKLDNSSVKVQIKPLQLQLLELIKDVFVSWRDTVELMPIRLTYEVTKFMDFTNTSGDVDKWINKYMADTGRFACRFNDNPNCNYVSYKGIESEKKYKKCCKRGNDVYIKLMYQKFKPLLESKEHKQFFSTVINKNRKRVRKTKLLYITGTCDHSITGDIANSWLKFGSYWNSFITNIKQQFNKIEYIRAWQSHDNGYPHFHALVYFKDFDFTATFWDEDKSWRIHNRQKLKGKYVRDRLKNAWVWGNLDIKCCDDSKKALVDLLKYITRDLEGGASDLTNAMVWYFGKQSYSFSKGFASLFDANACIAEPSNADLINAEGVIQRSNSNKKLIMIEVFPMISREQLPKSVQLRIDTYEDPPDPPPEYCDFFDNWAAKCVPSSFRINEDGVKIVVYKLEESMLHGGRY